VKRLVLGPAACALAAATLLAQALAREEIENARRYDKHGDPRFSVVAASSLPKSIQVAAGRSYAVFGYNTPSVVVTLPATDNSAYAIVEFKDPKPVGRDGKPIPHEIEQGIYDAESHSTQIRFGPPSGSKDLVPLARASGGVAVKYPLEIKTTVVAAGSPETAKLGMAVDGPYVKYRPEAVALPQAASFSGIDALRAYDAAGKRLERYDGVQKSELTDGVSTRTIAFWGPVASVRYDTVVGWFDVTLRFDLPAAPLRPAGREGQGP